MLTSSFCHLPGVGPKTEQTLWSAGLLCWETALANGGDPPPRPIKRSWLPHLRESVVMHRNRDIDYFTTRLPASQHWRLFRDYRPTCAFVDIETTGLSQFTDEITTIVLYDGRTIRHYVNGQNLNDFQRDIQDYRLLITYNGKTFDVPFIEHFFGIRLQHAHIDLRYVLRGLGYAGGQKHCEKRLGIRRGQSADIDGFMAVQLWHAYRRTKDRRFLDTLLAYNVEDAVNLEVLMVFAFNLNVQHTPFTDLSLPAPTPPPPPVRADPGVVARLVRQMW